MNPPSSSSSKSTKPHHRTNSKLEPKTKKNLSSGNPLQDLNTTIVTPSNSKSSSNSNNSSFEAPRGCLRVFDVNLTPLSKVATGSGLDFRENEKEIDVDDDEKLSIPSGNENKTPPIQASVSPEIQTQCGSSIVATATTPACYAAGYVVSGVTDKRKCRPRGILTVGENNVLDFGAAKDISGFDEDDDSNKENVLGVVGNSSTVSMLPLPAEASMHWLLSPCNEEDEDHKENSEIGSCRYQIHSPNSSLFDDEFNFSDLFVIGSNSRSSVSISARKRRSTSLYSPGEGILWPSPDNEAVLSTPNCTSSCKGAGLEEERKRCDDFDRENSPSSMDISGSRNVVQTPESDSSSDRGVGLSRLKAEAASNSVDLSHFQKILDDRSSWMSTSTLGNVSQSQMRISWREGLVSRIFEMDEFDSCRYLSDEEEDASEYYNEQLKSCQNPEFNVDEGKYEILKNGFGSAEFVDTELKTGEKSEERLPSQLSCSCAESISTDGGGLTGFRGFGLDSML
ncbi:hypothetical protein Pint_26445 [Pistacia integerrima]|uniref:Uncharacterized protein n=1 Tax=Pistacia integerrima TaxID=434235 RepID=A0ACC0YDN7_9ROSI|nr:hypothetical protein Pint_26445 [Pistacia integerrima]